MDNDDKNTKVQDLIKNFNKSNQHVFVPTNVLPKKVKPHNDRRRVPSNSTSDSEGDVYDEIQEPPLRSCLKKEKSYTNKGNKEEADKASYEEVQKPPQYSYLKKQPYKTKPDQQGGVEEESDTEDTSDEDTLQDNRQLGRYLNVPEIVDETKNFLREEEDYCRLLADLVENYKNLKADKFDNVFDVLGGINLICNFQNNTFLPELKSTRNVVEIAESFIKHKKLFSTFYEHYFKNRPNMILLMNDYKDIFKAGRSKEQCKENDRILLEVPNQRILTYTNFLESMKRHLDANIDVTSFDRAIAVLANLTKLFSPRDENIRFLISEMVETERVYIERLENITEQIIPKIGNVIRQKSRQKSIIGNISLIHINQLNFYKEMEQCLITFDANEIGNCFLQHKNDFMQYVKDQQMKDDPEAIDECRELLQHSEKNVDFHAPLNRLYKYKILLGALKNSCDKGNVPCDKVADALNMVTGIISKMNGVAAINCIKDENVYLEEQGELILRDEFMVAFKSHKYDAMIFLFEKSLILTEVETMGQKKNLRDAYIYKNHIISKRLSVVPKSDSPTAFEVEFHGKTKKVYVLKARDEKTKEVWIAALGNMLMKQFQDAKKRHS